MSVAGGLVLGIERALKLRIRALQIFTKNASQWPAPAIEDHHAASFRGACRSRPTPTSSTARPHLVAVCFDTCHVHAAGYDLVTERGCAETFEEFDRTLGCDSLRVFHVNDSKNERGSRVDRHEHLGRGRLGPEPFARILRDARFRAVPKLLETPKGKDGGGMDRRNLAFLRRLAAMPEERAGGEPTRGAVVS